MAPRGNFLPLGAYATGPTKKWWPFSIARANHEHICTKGKERITMYQEPMPQPRDEREWQSSSYTNPTDSSEYDGGYKGNPQNNDQLADAIAQRIPAGTQSGRAVRDADRGAVGASAAAPDAVQCGRGTADDPAPRRNHQAQGRRRSDRPAGGSSIRRSRVSGGEQGHDSIFLGRRRRSVEREGRRLFAIARDPSAEEARGGIARSVCQGDFRGP